MGVDAGIFAKKAKKYFWFDRLSNIDSYWNLPDWGSNCYLEIRDNLMNRNNTLTTYEILNFLRANVEAWELGEESQRYHANWVRGIISFVEAHPEDQFFVALDNDDAYDLIGEMNGEKGGLWTGEYTQYE